MSLKISVLTPSYNSVNFLDRAIQSVTAQDYTNWEHIVMDADSQDGTKEILASYPHLIWQSEPDKGQSDAMNKAFAKCTGDIIVYLNADDYFKEGAFSAVIEAFDANSNCDMVVANLEMITPDGQKQVHVPSIRLEDILLYINYDFPLNPVSYFYKREVQFGIGQFPIDNHFTMDYWFLLRAYKQFIIQKLEFVTGVFVQDGANKSSQGYKSQISLYKTFVEFVSTLPRGKHEIIESKLFQTFAKSVRMLFDSNNEILSLRLHADNLTRNFDELKKHTDSLSIHADNLTHYNEELKKHAENLSKQNETLQNDYNLIYYSRWWQLKVKIGGLFKG